MTRSFSIISSALICLSISFSMTSQIAYPYNPDGNTDSLIGVSDLQDVLSVFGSPFNVQSITVDTLDLEAYLNFLLQKIVSLENALLQEENAFSNHGHLEISPGTEAEWIVPQGVNLIEVTLYGGNGSPGAGSNNCAYAGGAVGGCGGAPGGIGRLLLGVIEGDTIVITAGSTPSTPAPIGGCGVGQNGFTGLPSELSVNSESIMIATGGGGGKGVWCSCGNSYNGCGNQNFNPAPSSGSVTGPFIDSGAILLESVSGGGGACLLRY